MAYAFERDDVRQELRRGASGTVSFWPKVEGVGNVSLSADPTFVITKPGTETITSGTATRTTVGAVTRVDVTVDATSLDYLEDYAAVVTWVYSSVTRVTTVRFDVVLEPWTAELSLNDFQAELADASQRLERLALAQGSGRTAEIAASELGWLAWGDVRTQLRRRAEQAGQAYPRMILNREEVRRIVIATAISRLFRASGGPPEGENALNARAWADRAESLSAGLPEIRYASEASRAESLRLPRARSVVTRRGWP